MKKNLFKSVKVSAAALMGASIVSTCGGSIAMMSPQAIESSNNKINANMSALEKDYPHLIWRDINPNEARPVDPNVVARYFATRLPNLDSLLNQITA